LNLGIEIGYDKTALTLTNIVANPSAGATTQHMFRKKHRQSIQLKIRLYLQ